MATNGQIRGVALLNMTSEERHQVLSAINEGLQRDSFHVTVRRAYKLSEAPLAHVAVMEPSGHGGKLILYPWA